MRESLASLLVIHSPPYPFLQPVPSRLWSPSHLAGSNDHVVASSVGAHPSCHRSPSSPASESPLLITLVEFGRIPTYAQELPQPVSPLNILPRQQEKHRQLE